MIFAENLPFHTLEYGVHICLEVDACFDMEFKGHDVHFLGSSLRRYASVDAKQREEMVA